MRLRKLRFGFDQEPVLGEELVAQIDHELGRFHRVAEVDGLPPAQHGGLPLLAVEEPLELLAEVVLLALGDHADRFRGEPVFGARATTLGVIARVG